MKANRSLGVLGIFVALTVALSGCAVGIEETSSIESGDWAADDTLSIARDEAGTTGDVRSNDDPPDDDSPTKISGWTDGSRGAVEYNGDGTFTYTPDANIDSGSDSFTYTAVDGQGNFSTATVNVTIAAGWGRAVTVSTHVGSYDQVTDDNGNTTVVWSENDGTRLNVWSKRYVAATKTWGSAQKIDSSDDDKGQGITVSAIVDSAGNVTAVWRQSADATGSRYDLWSNRFTASSGVWGTAEKIETEDLGNPQSFYLAVDGTGRVIVAWYQSDGTRNNIWANRYASGAWGAAQKLETDDTSDAYLSGLPIQVDANGNATVIWYQWDLTRYNIFANRVNSSGTWGTATAIETDAGTLGYTNGFAAEVDSAGTVTVVWSQYNGTRYNIYANRLPTTFTFNGTPVAATTVDTEEAGDAYAPSIVLNATSKDIIAVWYQSDGTRYNMWAGRNAAGAGTWTSVGKIETTDLGSVSAPKVVIDSAGNVTAIWRQADGSRNDMWSNRFNNSTVAWGTATKIETDDSGSVSSQVVVVDDSGNVTAAWPQYDGTRDNIVANRMTSAGVWGTATTIDTEDLGNADTIRMTVGSTGLVDMAWRQFDTERYNIWTARYSAGAWTTADRLTSGLLGAGATPVEIFNTESDVPTLIAASSNGAASTLWVSDFR
jgi:hypothetical protein